MSDAGEIATSIFDSVRQLPGGVKLVDESFGQHIVERVLCEPCQNRITHQNDYVEHFFNASATAMRNQLRVCP